MNVSAQLELAESFLVLAEELNFRRAAHRLALDQSALSRRIRKLEGLLGFAVFERTTRQVRLTPAGRALYEANAGLMHGFADSVNAARRVAAGRTGTLRLGYMAFAAIDLMPDAVSRFRTAAPDVDLRIAYMRTQGQKLALADGTLDLGYLIGPFEHAEFHSLTVAVDPLCVVMPAGHPLAESETIDPVRLDDVRLVLGDMAEWEAYRWRLDAMFAARGIGAAPALEGSSTLALLGLVRAGLGVTIYPSRIGAILGRDLVLRPIDDPSFRVETALVWRRANRSAVVRTFADIARRLAHRRGPD